jgi:S1-C subfamily serine protease
MAQRTGKSDFPPYIRKDIAMTAPTDILTQLSAALAARTKEAAPIVVGLEPDRAPPSSGILWRKDLVVASEQALPRSAGAVRIPLPDGSSVSANVIGRDPGTNVAVLRLAETADVALPIAAEPVLGSLVLVMGADGAGGATARLGMVRSLGPAWHSRAGGRIDSRIALDTGLGRSEEGGPVLDAAGHLVGMSTRGPRDRTLVIPAATVARVLEPLVASGRVARGWLGLALQPVSLPDAANADHARPGPEGQGLMVMGVTGESPAAKAGVLAGDIVTALDGVATTHPGKLAEMLGPDAIGKALELRLIRAGAPLALSVTIDARAG